MKRRTVALTLIMVMGIAAMSVATHGVHAAPPPQQPGASSNAGGHLPELLSLLPALPLGGNDSAFITYANIAGQMDALGLPNNPTLDEAAAIRNQAVLSVGSLPARSVQMRLPEWRAAFGFDLSQVDQALEYSALPFTVTILVGRFDQSTLQQAWTATGYKPVAAGDTSYYSIRDDYDIDLANPVSRLALASVNDVALLDEHTLVYSSARKGVEGVIEARAGKRTTMGSVISIAPMLPTLPADLTSAIIIHGSDLIATPDPRSVLDQMATPGADMGAVATAIAREIEEARKLPPVAAALIGATGGGPVPALRSDATPAPPRSDIATATAIVALTMISHDAAEAAVPVIEERLATQRLVNPPPQGDTYAVLYPNRSVTAITGQPVVLVELHPTPAVPRNVLVKLFFFRALTFVAWSP